MIKILDCNNKNYVSKLSKLLIKRKSDDKIIKNIVIFLFIDGLLSQENIVIIKFEKKGEKEYFLVKNKK